MRPLTPTRSQVEVLDYIQAYRERNGYSPTLREIARGLGNSSAATIAEHIDSLERLRLVRREHGRARSIIPTQTAISLLDGRTGQAPGGGVSTGAPAAEPGRTTVIPLMGTIAAGEPIEALEAGDELEVLSSMLPGPRCYALKVRGTSMIDEGILEGDYVIVEPCTAPENGDTVVALIDGHEATLKRFYRERSRGSWRIRLQPANPAMKPILLGADANIEIQGRVRSLLRVL